MFEQWVEAVRPENVRLTAGLDIGFEDADAFSIIAYVPKLHAPKDYADPRDRIRYGDVSALPGQELTRKRWLIWEYKARRTGLTELANAITKGLAETSRRCLDLGISASPQIFSDTGGGGAKMVHDLRTIHKLPVRPAYKRDKVAALELLQDEVRAGDFIVPVDGEFAREAEVTVWTKDPDTGMIIREIDDRAFHPDFLDSVLYAMRSIWATTL
ncbi:hypothetical protein CCP3SC15_5090003 [Gammaproteobacteria bacterium]